MHVYVGKPNFLYAHAYKVQYGKFFEENFPKALKPKEQRIHVERTRKSK